LACGGERKRKKKKKKGEKDHRWTIPRDPHIVYTKPGENRLGDVGKRGEKKKEKKGRKKENATALVACEPLLFPEKGILDTIERPRDRNQERKGGKEREKGRFPAGAGAFILLSRKAPRISVASDRSHRGGGKGKKKERKGEGRLDRGHIGLTLFYEKSMASTASIERGEGEKGQRKKGRRNPRFGSTFQDAKVYSGRHFQEKREGKRKKRKKGKKGPAAPMACFTQDLYNSRTERERKNRGGKGGERKRYPASLTRHSSYS